MTSQSYLLISEDDYFHIRKRGKHGDKIAFMQSVVKYLERHSISYKEQEDGLCIYTRDLFHAREICEYLGIAEVRYFEDGKQSKFFNAEEIDDSDDEDEKYGNTLAVLRDSLYKGDRSKQSTIQEIMLFPFYGAVTLVVDDLIQEVYFGTSSNSDYTRIDVCADFEYIFGSSQVSTYGGEFDLLNGAQLIHIDTLDWKYITSPVVYSIDIYNSKNEVTSYTLTLKDAFTQGSIVDLLFAPKKGRLVELVRES